MNRDREGMEFPSPYFQPASQHRSREAWRKRVTCLEEEARRSEFVRLESSSAELTKAYRADLTPVETIVAATKNTKKATVERLVVGLESSAQTIYRFLEEEDHPREAVARYNNYVGHWKEVAEDLATILARMFEGQAAFRGVSKNDRTEDAS